MTADAGKGDAKPAAGETLLTKSTGEKPAETKTETKAEAKPDAKDTKPAPVEYEKWEPKAVDGVKRPEPTLKAFREAGKKFGLSTEQMQGLVDFDDARTKSLAAEERAERARAQQGWREAIQNDKEFGGSKFKESAADVERLMKAYADDEIRQLLDESGYGDHPAMFRFVARLAKATREDSVVGGPKGGASGAEKPTLLEQLYGSASAKS